jgi:uncharacterized protein
MDNTNEAIKNKIAHELGIDLWQVENTLALYNDGATVPFIARYRKEKTGGLTDENILQLLKIFKRLNELEERRNTVLNSMKEQGVLTGELEKLVKEAATLPALEDIYLPYKPKRKTRGVKAVERGLEPLAKMLMSENVESEEIAARKFVNPQHGVETTADALAGARDIIAEWIAETVWVRNFVRREFQRNALIVSKAVKGKEEEGAKYRSWFHWEEKAVKAAPHRILAIFRGENEGFLKVKIEPDIEYVTEELTRRLVRSSPANAENKSKAIKESVKRLLFPAMETELRNELKKRADENAVKVFAGNLEQLLLAPPLGRKNVLAIDPGFRTGCKVVCIDKNGNLLHNETIYPHPPKNEVAMAIKKIKSMVERYKIEAIAIGNGTAGRETDNFISRIRFDRELVAVMVNEDGASVYSASATAREEFPEYDITVMGAVSIGRRLQDPLAELVKIDPKSLGVGQYQHDVNGKLLKESLQTTVELCVNKVGVELNLASKELLTYVSGIGPSLAKNIVDYRMKNGAFKNREELKKVKGLGEKAFQQAAGFLRIKDGENPLDASAVHPENYKLVDMMSKKAGIPLKELINNKKVKSIIKASDFVSATVGLPTVNDILDELEKPGRDPRKRLEYFSFDKNIKTIEDLSEGMVLPAVVTNLTDFGAFVDLGIHVNGLIHKSQIADEYVLNPADYLSLGQHLSVKVISVDVERKRIGLSLKGM